MTDWNAIVDREGPNVWRILWRLLNHETDVEECFQETFIAALKVSRKETVQVWPALLCRLATARALDRLRTRYRHNGRRNQRDAAQRNIENAPASDPLDAAESHSAGPFELAVMSELAERLRIALTRLPQKQAEIFALHALDGWSRLEIAAHMCMTDNAVGVALHRARQSLRELLGDADEFTSTSSRSLSEGGNP